MFFKQSNREEWFCNFFLRFSGHRLNKRGTVKLKLLCCSVFAVASSFLSVTVLLGVMKVLVQVKLVDPLLDV